MSVWFTSDTHYGHVNICRGVSNWTSGFRDFDTLEEMNDKLVDNINLHVRENDTLYHIGDWSMGGFANARIFRDRIHCKNIHLVLGNHDHEIKKNRDNIQEVFSSVQQIKFGKIAGQIMVLCHFPMLIWDGHHNGAWHLHGHSHNNLSAPEYYIRKVKDVGVDAHPEFRPFHIDELQSIMQDRRIVALDHHNDIADY